MAAVVGAEIVGCKSSDARTGSCGKGEVPMFQIMVSLRPGRFEYVRWYCVIGL